MKIFPRSLSPTLGLQRSVQKRVVLIIDLKMKRKVPAVSLRNGLSANLLLVRTLMRYHTVIFIGYVIFCGCKSQSFSGWI
jgi:hypothetical protein